MNRDKFLKIWNDILLPDCLLVLCFIRKSMKMLGHISLDWYVSLLYSLAVIFILISIIREKKSYVELQGVSSFTENVWAILDRMVWIISILNIYDYSGWKNVAIYISTLVILVSYISLQIYLYSTHKLTFRKR